MKRIGTVALVFFFVILLSQAKMELNKNIPEVVKEVSPSVVHIYSETMHWQGSGFFIAKDIIATARHVGETGTDFTITLHDGTKLKSTKCVSFKDHDLAYIILEKPYEEAKVVKLGRVSEMDVGETIVAIGSPFGMVNQNFVSSGVLSMKGKNLEGECPGWGWGTLFGTDTPGHPGNSGCPVFNLEGQAIGVLVGGRTPVMVVCVPTELINLRELRLYLSTGKYYIEQKPEPVVESWEDYNAD